MKTNNIYCFSLKIILNKKSIDTKSIKLRIDIFGLYLHLFRSTIF